MRICKGIGIPLGDVLLVDGLTETAGTLLKKNGALDIYAGVAHALLAIDSRLICPG
jgi:hypothetical protein